MKASAEAGIALFTKNLKEATSLSFDQFHSTVDAVEKAHPAPEGFAAVSKTLKEAATTAENNIAAAMEKGAAAVASVSPASKAKKTR